MKNYSSMHFKNKKPKPTKVKSPKMKIVALTVINEHSYEETEGGTKSRKKKSNRESLIEFP